MATRRAVAASIASAVLFSSLILSNFIIFSGAAQGFRYDSLAAEEETYFDRALVVRSLAVLDLLDGAQALISSNRFVCSSAAVAISLFLATERVDLASGGLSAASAISLAADATISDNLTTLRPFAGSVRGWTNMMTTSSVRGESPDGTVIYDKTEVHLLSLPLRLDALTADCLDAQSKLSSALSALGTNLCNSTILSEAVSSVSDAVSLSGNPDGFSVTIAYGIVSTKPCEVEFAVSARQSDIPGPAGTFGFTEEEVGHVWA